MLDGHGGDGEIVAPKKNQPRAAEQHEDRRAEGGGGEQQGHSRPHQSSRRDRGPRAEGEQAGGTQRGEGATTPRGSGVTEHPQPDDGEAER